MSFRILFDISADTMFSSKTVAIAGHNNDWAAYRGPSDWSDEAVVADGDKLSKREAEPLFWVMICSGRTYR